MCFSVYFKPFIEKKSLQDFFKRAFILKSVNLMYTEITDKI